MNATTTFILSLSCGLPLLAFLFSGNRVGKMFHPLFVVFVIAFCTEIVVGIDQLYFRIKGFTYYAYIFACIAYLYFYLLFYLRTGVLKKKEHLQGITLFFIAACLINWLLLYKQEQFFSFFRIALLYASIILFFSVELFSRQIFAYDKAPAKNPLLLVGVSGIIFHCFWIFLVSLLLLKTKDRAFVGQVFDIQKFVNIFCYLIYTIAVLCIPKTVSYTK